MAMQDLVGKPRVIAEASGRQHRRHGKHRFQEPLALQRHPGGLVVQAAGVAGRDHRIAQMEVIAMLPREAGHDHMAFLIGWAPMAFEPSEGLEQSEGAQLERVEIEGIALGCHGRSGAARSRFDYSERRGSSKPGVTPLQWCLESGASALVCGGFWGTTKPRRI